MTTAYTSLLGLALPVTGELSGTWGDTVNNSITSLLDSAVAGTTNVSTDGDVTLTTTTGAANTAREAILLFSGARTALRTVTAPAQSKIYTVINATTGGFSVKLVGAGPTTGVTILAGESAVCAWNGSDFIKVSNTSGAGVFTSLTDTGLTSGRVTFASAGGLLADSANLTWDGTTLSAVGRLYNGSASTFGASTWAMSLGNGGVSANYFKADSTYWQNSAGTQTMQLSSGTLTTANDASVNGLTVGRGAGAIGTNTAVGASALAANVNGYGNDAFGYNALLSTTDGYSNAGIGRETLRSNTTGANNVAVGRGALYSNTTASNNTAVGYQAGYSNTSTGPITALGYQAAYTNNGGTDIAAVGWKALYSNTTGYNNNAFGTESLYANTTGLWNSAFGHGSLYTNTTGSYNTAIGPLALRLNTTASYNTAVGYQAGYSNTIGTFNSFLGRAAGYQTTGSYNTMVGDAAGYLVTSGAYNFYAGYSAGPNASTLSTGSYNVGLGAQALYNNTTASNNTAVGYQAAYSNTTGTQLVAVGVQALQYNTTGSVNTALGDYALRNSTTGNYNVASGSEALYKNTTGGYNTAHGAFSLHENTTVSNNTAVGYQAGYANTTGSPITAIGTQALNGNTTGSYNVGVGWQVLSANTTGNFNVAVGDRALVSNTSASYNTAVGYQAGYAYSGSNGYNTLFGYQAGYSMGGGIGNYANVFIGHQAGYAANGSTSENLYNTFVGPFAGQAVTTGAKNTILGRYSGNQGGLDIRTASNYIVLSDGDGLPWSVINGNTGTASMRQAGYNNITPVMRVSGFNYSQGSYRAIVVGGAATAGTYNTLCLGYDPAGNASGNFSGSGGEIFFPNGINFKTPNSTDTSFLNVLSFSSSGYGLQVYRSVGVGGADPTSSGSGIAFPATQDASTDPNTLDDYEEGTFTPTLAGGFSSGPTTYTQNSGSYTKIGRYVFFQLDLDANGATADGSNVKIGGLPFASSAPGAFAGASISYQVNFNTNATDTYHITGASTAIDVYDVSGNGRAGNAAGVNINNRIILFGSYQTST